jgi:FkbM family methyltransferase
MSSAVRRLIQSTANRWGYRVVKSNGSAGVAEQWTQGLDTFSSLLQGFGFRPTHIIDVGANRGNWTRRAAKFFPSTRYTLVEPQGNLKQYISDLLQAGAAITWISAGVSDQHGTLPFTIGQTDSTSTFYFQSESNPGGSSVSIPVLTLNEIAAAHGVPELVKIDAEGFDLKVLGGASELLGRTDVFLVEVTICAALYENSLAQVVRLMDEKGYKVADITDLNRSPKHGVLWLCELAFVRRGSGLFEVGTEYI